MSQEADGDGWNQLTATRRAALGGIGAAGLGTFAGCVVGNSNADNTELRIASAWKPSAIDPISGDWPLGQIGVFESLVGVDREMETRPALAADWSVSRDELTWTFDLREDVEFHDGRAMNAEAAKFSLTRAFEQADLLVDLPVETIEATGGHELSIITSEPFAPLLSYLTRRDATILSPASVEDGEFVEPICTGPYAFEDWEPEESLTVTANTDYYGETPTIERVVYEGHSDSQTKVLNLQAGDMDIADLLPASAVADLEANDDVTVDVTQTSAIRFFNFNVRRPPFDDRRVRQAVLHATDIERIIDTVLEGVSWPATGVYSPDVTDWANEGLEPYSYDPEKARTMLAEAGWELEDGNIRTRDGDSFEITLGTYHLRPELEQMAQVIQDQLAEVGIDVDITVMEWATLEEDMQAGEFDVNLVSFSVFWWPDPDRAMSFYHSEDTVVYSGYDNPEVDDLIEAGRVETDPDERKRIYDEVQEIIHRDTPLGILTYSGYITGVRDRVSGFEPHPGEYSYDIERLNLE